MLSGILFSLIGFVGGLAVKNVVESCHLKDSTEEDNVLLLDLPGLLQHYKSNNNFSENEIRKLVTGIEVDLTKSSRNINDSKILFTAFLCIKQFVNDDEGNLRIYFHVFHLRCLSIRV